MLESSREQKTRFELEQSSNLFLLLERAPAEERARPVATPKGMPFGDGLRDHQSKHCFPLERAVNFSTST